jgi:nicotinate-nucleotide adenylyltransferase
MRIGVMGGTYNPFHLGHSETALEVKKKALLEKMILIPSNISPHKDDLRMIIPSLHRYAMAVLGTIDEPGLEVSPIEIEAGGVSYTYKTIAALRKTINQGDELFYVTGVESFKKIATWKKWQKLVDSVDFIINSRTGYQTADLLKIIPENLTERCIFTDNGDNIIVKNMEMKRIYIIETKKIDISSSLIREKIAKRESIHGMVHPLVERYIELNKLYKEDNK